MHSFNYIPKVKHSVLNVNGDYFDISQLYKQTAISKLWKGMIGSQQIHWDYVENVGKIKMVHDWKKIGRGKVPILTFKIKKPLGFNCFLDLQPVLREKSDQFSVVQFKSIPFRKCIKCFSGNNTVLVIPRI